MKRIIVVLICIAGAILLLLALEQWFFPAPFKGEVVETWETSNAPFKIRVNKHIERGGFMPIIGGAYYDFQSAANGSDQWREIMTFRHDDPVNIPREQVRFVNDRVAYVFMGWMYAVTIDGGNSWRVSKMWDFLPNDERCLYNCIADLRIDGNGTGKVKLNIIGNPQDRLKVLETNDFGRSWREP